MKTAILAKMDIDHEFKRIEQNVGFKTIPEDSRTELQAIYNALECDMIDVVYFDGFQAFVDDEGLLKSGNAVIKYKSEGFDVPLAGNVLFCKGVDSEGATVWFDLKKDSDLIYTIHKMINKAKFLGVTQ